MFRQVSPRVIRIAGTVLTGLTVLLAFQHRSAAQKAPLTDKDILPIVNRCLQCHGEALKMGGLDLHTRDGMLKGGAGGPSIIAGNAANSLLIKRVTGQIQPVMPMAPVPALNEKEIATLKDWIDQGAQWTAQAAPATAARRLQTTPRQVLTKKSPSQRKNGSGGLFRSPSGVPRRR
jgi:hypothetical protein